MPSKYVDTNAIIQVIGCVYNAPYLLDMDEKYSINEEDFPSNFHKILFGSIYKIHELGANSITLLAIEDFLKGRPKSEAIFKQYKGEEWILKASENSSISTFDYYYNRLKKMTLLRVYDDCGIDVSDIYDPDNIIDSKKKQEQEEYLDNVSLVEIADKINNKVDAIRLEYVDETYGQNHQAAEDIYDLIESLKTTPEFGVSLYGDYINTVTRGARLGKYYLRSAASGVGKTRAMAADACYIACNEYFNIEHGCWEKIGQNHPTLFITTELDLKEVQTLFLAFLSGVNEENILNGHYENDEEERVYHAAEILSKSPLYVEELMDFNLQDVENVIKKNIRDNDISYVFYDYLHSSLKILAEVATQTKGMKLREDNILFMLSNRLKNICNKYGIFLMSATQLSGDFKDSDTPDQQLLRGAKAIADKIDMGSILLSVTQKDRECLESIITQGYDIPNMKISIYKNRRGKWKSVYLWCKADLGICQINPIFATTWNYEFLPINNIKIND